MALVCWSGGLDSTLLLHDLLREQKLSEPVRTLSIHHSNVGAWEEQKLARDRLKKHFEKLGHKLSCLEVEVKSSDGMFVQGEGIRQAVIWLTLGAQYLNNGEGLYLGYIKGDDFWHYHSWANQLFTASCALMGKECKLELPLEWVDKSHVIDRLGKLAPKCFWCESPIKGGKPCKYCHKCREFKLANIKEEFVASVFRVGRHITKRK